MNVKRGGPYSDHCTPVSYSRKFSSILKQTKVSSLRQPDMRCRAVWYQSFFLFRRVMPPSRSLKEPGSSSVKTKPAGSSETSLTFTELCDGNLEEFSG